MNYKELLLECYDLYFEKYANQSQKTVANKKHVIDGFLSSLPQDVSYISYDNILQWQGRINVAPNTLNGKLVILRQFLMFSQTQGLQTDIPTMKKYIDDYVPYLFSQEELQRLMEVADNNISHSPIASTKTFCFPMALRLLAYCGTRLNETLTLRWEDYDEETKVLILRNTKRKKERYVPLHSTVNELLRKYKRRFRWQYGDCNYLFPDDSLTRHITKQQFEYEFGKASRNAGIFVEREYFQRGVCAHCLRHTFAVNSFRKSIEDGTDIIDAVPLLSTYLGHERLQETEKYLKFSFDLFPDAEEAFDEYSSVIFGEALP